MSKLEIVGRTALRSDRGPGYVGAVELSDGTACTPMGMPERSRRADAMRDADAVIWQGDGPVYIEADTA